MLSTYGIDTVDCPRVSRQITGSRLNQVREERARDVNNARMVKIRRRILEMEKT